MTGLHAAIFTAVVIGGVAVTGFANWVGATPLVEPAQYLTHSSSEAQSPPIEDDISAEQPKSDDEGEDLCLASSAFPESILRWCDDITSASRSHDVDPNLIAAVMLQESGGNPDAYSVAGAVGLMQVMPRDGIAATFQCINGPCFASRPSTEELLEPSFNIDYGTRMLAGLIAKKGSEREGLFAYGPSGMGYAYADKVLALYDRYH